MFSISWYLPEKVRDEMSKTQHFEIFEKVIFRKLPSIIYIYIYLYTYIYGQWHNEGEKREQTKHKTWFPLVGTCQKKCEMKCQKHSTSKFSKKRFSKTCSHTYIYMCIYIHGQWHKEGEKREQTKHQTWFPLVGACQKKCGVKCQKHNTFKFSKKLFFQKLPSIIYLYTYIYGQ